jgi:hypothetical protein
MHNKETDVEVAGPTRAESRAKTSKRIISTPELPRSMPFADLGRIRAERDAFERRAAAIRNDANCRRWMKDGEEHTT